METPNS